MPQLFVHSFLRRRSNPKKYDTSAVLADEDESTKVAVSCDKEAVPRISSLQERTVRRSGQTEVDGCHHVGSLRRQYVEPRHPHVMICEDSHEEDTET